MSNININAIPTLLQFDPDTHFLTTNLYTERKESGYFFKYSLKQTIKKALGYYDPRIIGQNLCKYSVFINKEKNFDVIAEIVNNILCFNSKIISQKKPNFIHDHFKAFFRAMIDEHYPRLNIESRLGTLVLEVNPPSLPATRTW